MTRVGRSRHYSPSREPRFSEGRITKAGVPGTNPGIPPLLDTTQQQERRLLYEVAQGAESPPGRREKRPSRTWRRVNKMGFCGGVNRRRERGGSAKLADCSMRVSPVAASHGSRVPAKWNLALWKLVRVGLAATSGEDYSAGFNRSANSVIRFSLGNCSAKRASRRATAITN